MGENENNNVVPFIKPVVNISKVEDRCPVCHRSYCQISNGSKICVYCRYGSKGGKNG